MWKRSVDSYSTGSKWLHWIVAFLVIFMLSLSFFLGDVPKPSQPTAYMIHKSVGLLILFLMLIRLFWILYCGKPELPYGIPKWEKQLAHVTHLSMYLFLIAMPIIGWLRSQSAGRTPTSFGLFPLPFPGIPENKAFSEFMADAHEIVAYILIALITLHIIGALKHQLIDKNNLIRRMLGDARKNS